MCNVPRGYSRAKLAKELYKAGFRPGEDFDMSRIRIPAQGAQQCFDVYLWLRDVEVLRKFAAALNGLRLPAPSKASRSGVVSVRTIEPLPEEESSGLSKVDVSAELDPLWVTPKLCVEKQACWRPPGQFETPPHVPRPELAVSGGHREATRALFCTGCGLVVPEGARFCSGCGCSAALVVSMPYCSRCGAANSSSHHKFCHDCGAALPCRAV